MAANAPKHPNIQDRGGGRALCYNLDPGRPSPSGDGVGGWRQRFRDGEEATLDRRECISRAQLLESRPGQVRD